ncbi:tyrosine-type recombinase/integrase [Cytobacillus praedii]|uniref:tyrosine-type recombinase/integrase n=1 Tax=Cytobacillus praedii TaxID=1742358 RepID=UPI002E24ECB1|nr:tyrosine-type recombinase/integrase [Cytobacillus praedii]MED3550170.1 tyrosine-type recombinase/integrase [Cytobacillus praedii]
MQANVIKLENENMKVLNIINAYFEHLKSNHRDFEGERTDRTQKEYETDIRQFYYLMKNKFKGKELEFLTMEDLYISKDTFKNYIEVLKTLRKTNGDFLYTNKTINRKKSSVRNYLRYLKNEDYIQEDISYLSSIKGEKERSKSYGAYEPHEVLEIAERAMREKRNGEEKRLLILLIYKTGLRKDETLQLTWDDFIEKEDGVAIQFVGKGYEDYEMMIPNDFYEELKSIKGESNKVFQMSPRSISDMITRINEDMGLSKKRKLVLHSIRKCFGTVVYRATGDINEARKALRHSSIATTQLYLGTENFKLHNTLFGVDKLDNELYKKVDHETLIKALENCPKSLLLTLNLKINEIN